MSHIGTTATPPAATKDRVESPEPHEGSEPHKGSDSVREWCARRDVPFLGAVRFVPDMNDQRTRVAVEQMERRDLSTRIQRANEGWEGWEGWEGCEGVRCGDE